MANGIRIGDPGGFNKGRSSKFCEDSRVQQIPEEGRRTYRPKLCGNYLKLYNGVQTDDSDYMKIFTWNDLNISIR